MHTDLGRFSFLDPNPQNMQNENQTIEQIFALKNKFKFHLVNYHLIPFIEWYIKFLHKN